MLGLITDISRLRVMYSHSSATMTKDENNKLSLYKQGRMLAIALKVGGLLVIAGGVKIAHPLIGQDKLFSSYKSIFRVIIAGGVAVLGGEAILAGKIFSLCLDREMSKDYAKNLFLFWKDLIVLDARKLQAEIKRLDKQGWIF